MTPENFIYWLQGYIEIGDPKQMSSEQIEIIKDHIALVLKKETPKRAEAPTISIAPVQPGILTQPLGPYQGGAAHIPYCTKGPLGTRCNQLSCKTCNGPLIAVC